MANSNPQAVRIANERFRPFADRIAQAYHFAGVFKTQIEAEGIDSLFPADKEPINDGSALDGRSPLSNEDVKGLIAAVDAIRAFMDADPAMRDLLLRVAVNPMRF